MKQVSNRDNKKGNRGETMPRQYITIAEREELGLSLRRGDIRQTDGARFYEYVKLSTGKVKEVWHSARSHQNKLDYLYDYGVQRAKRNKAFLKRVKLKHGCQMCGYKEHSAALHFDHIEPSKKHKGLAELMGTSLRMIKAEMRKCRILCANCHAVHTSNQRSNGDIFVTPKRT